MIQPQIKPAREKEHKFYRKWETRRRKKWRFILVGALFYAIPQTIGSYLWSIDFDFDFDQINAARAVSSLLFSILFGSLLSWLFYKSLDIRYRQLKDADLL